MNYLNGSYEMWHQIQNRFEREVLPHNQRPPYIQQVHRLHYVRTPGMSR